MEQILNAYGTFLLEGLAVVLLATLLFTGIADENGNRGICAILGAAIDTGGTDYSAYKDFDTYALESGKTAPEITCTVMSLWVGDTVCLTDCIQAVDYAGNPLVIVVESITGTEGENLLGQLDMESMKLILLSSGVCTVRVRATDDGGRRTIRTISIPVNG